ncbi:MAG: hypothetical protein ACRDHY_01750, partial [Anaerolineales bacterium]
VRQAMVGSPAVLTFSEPGVYSVWVGIGATARRIVFEIYRTRITSHEDGDVIPDGVPVTFTAETDPPGFEEDITWLASTSYGVSDPVRGEGRSFTVRFSDTFGRKWMAEHFVQWLGVRADNAVFGQDQKVPPSPDFRDVRIAQRDWTLTDGTVVSDTVWGEFTYSYDPVPFSTHYASFYVFSPETGGSAWVVQNLPISRSGFPLDARRETASFDLSEVGYRDGQPVQVLCHAATVSLLPSTQLPPPPRHEDLTCNSVGDELWDANDSSDPPYVIACQIPPPAAVKLQDPNPWVGPDRKIEGLETDTDGCMSGAIARSLGWVNAVKGLGMKADNGKSGAKDFQDDLYKGYPDSGTSRQKKGDETKPGNRAKRLQFKDDYTMAHGDKIVTEVWDSDGWVDPVPGGRVKETTEKDFLKWFKAEFDAGEDIEIAYHENEDDADPGIDHMVAVMNYAPQEDGSIVVKYKHDIRQGFNDGRDRDGSGDTVETGTIKADGGKFKMDGAFFVYYAVAESPKK